MISLVWNRDIIMKISYFFIYEEVMYIKLCQLFRQNILPEINFFSCFTKKKVINELPWRKIFWKKLPKKFDFRSIFFASFIFSVVGVQIEPLTEKDFTVSQEGWIIKEINRSQCEKNCNPKKTEKFLNFFYGTILCESNIT